MYIPIASMQALSKLFMASISKGALVRMDSARPLSKSIMALKPASTSLGIALVKPVMKEVTTFTPACMMSPNLLAMPLSKPTMSLIPPSTNFGTKSTIPFRRASNNTNIAVTSLGADSIIASETATRITFTTLNIDLPAPAKTSSIAIMPFPIATLLCFVYGMNTKKTGRRALLFAIGAVMGVIGCCIKPTAIIVEIAICIFLVLYKKRSFFKADILLPLLAAISFSLVEIFRPNATDTVF